ncbi:hypothetical protein [Shimia thalassica]|uniref:hypothetical protein n=1 Tax=Shimia thalassica TaxID=1715693 RepID=UPI0026E40C22|nr:hypothetical protein [Shimia thalassica]MDO6482716.1 hypothetical protein [Shimia thalassica]
MPADKMAFYNGNHDFWRELAASGESELRPALAHWIKAPTPLAPMLHRSRILGADDMWDSQFI